MIRGPALLTAHRMWVEGVPAADIAAAAGCSLGTLYKTANSGKFPRRRRGGGGTLKVDPSDPTPLQIQARALRLRIIHMAERRALG
jgi:hypothetical protein